MMDTFDPQYTTDIVEYLRSLGWTDEQIREYLAEFNLAQPETPQPYEPPQAPQQVQDENYDRLLAQFERQISELGAKQPELSPSKAVESSVAGGYEPTEAQLDLLKSAFGEDVVTPAYQAGTVSEIEQSFWKPELPEPRELAGAFKSAGGSGADMARITNMLSGLEPIPDDAQLGQLLNRYDLPVEVKTQLFQGLRAAREKPKESAWNEFKKGLQRGLYGFLSTASSGLAGIERILGMKESSIDDESSAAVMRAMAQSPEYEEAGTSVASILASQAGEFAGQQGPLIAASLPGSVAAGGSKAAQIAAMALSSFVPNYGESRQTLRDEWGVDDEGIALAAAGAKSILDGIGFVEGIGRAARSDSSKLIGSAVARAMEDAAEAGTTTSSIRTLGRVFGYLALKESGQQVKGAVVEGLTEAAQDFTDRFIGAAETGDWDKFQDRIIDDLSDTFSRVFWGQLGFGGGVAVGTGGRGAVLLVREGSRIVKKSPAEAALDALGVPDFEGIVKSAVDAVRPEGQKTAESIPEIPQPETETATQLAEVPVSGSIASLAEFQAPETGVAATSAEDQALDQAVLKELEDTELPRDEESALAPFRELSRTLLYRKAGEGPKTGGTLAAEAAANAQVSRALQELGIQPTEREIERARRLIDALDAWAPMVWARPTKEMQIKLISEALDNLQSKGVLRDESLIDGESASGEVVAIKPPHPYAAITLANYLVRSASRSNLFPTFERYALTDDGILLVDVPDPNVAAKLAPMISSYQPKMYTYTPDGIDVRVLSSGVPVARNRKASEAIREVRDAYVRSVFTQKTTRLDQKKLAALGWTDDIIRDTGLSPQEFLAWFALAMTEQRGSGITALRPAVLPDEIRPLIRTLSQRTGTAIIPVKLKKRAHTLGVTRTVDLGGKIASVVLVNDLGHSIAATVAHELSHVLASRTESLVRKIGERMQKANPLVFMHMSNLYSRSDVGEVFEEIGAEVIAAALTDKGLAVELAGALTEREARELADTFFKIAAAESGKSQQYLVPVEKIINAHKALMAQNAGNIFESVADAVSEMAKLAASVTPEEKFSLTGPAVEHIVAAFEPKYRKVQPESREDAGKTSRFLLSRSLNEIADAVDSGRSSPADLFETTSLPQKTIEEIKKASDALAESVVKISRSLAEFAKKWPLDISAADKETGMRNVELAGVPRWVASPSDIVAIGTAVYGLAKGGWSARKWYEQAGFSAASLASAFFDRPNPQPAEFAEHVVGVSMVLAALSQGANTRANMGATIELIRQELAGERRGVSGLLPNAIENARAILRGKARLTPDQLKIFPFSLAIAEGAAKAMRDVGAAKYSLAIERAVKKIAHEASYEDVPAVIDRWMFRAAGLPEEARSINHRRVAEIFVRAAADALGISHHEAQAAIWASIRMLKTATAVNRLSSYAEASRVADAFSGREAIDQSELVGHLIALGPHIMESWPFSLIDDFLSLLSANSVLLADGDAARNVLEKIHRKIDRLARKDSAIVLRSVWGTTPYYALAFSGSKPIARSVFEMVLRGEKPSYIRKTLEQHGTMEEVVDFAKVVAAASKLARENGVEMASFVTGLLTDPVGAQALAEGRDGLKQAMESVLKGSGTSLALHIMPPTRIYPERLRAALEKDLGPDQAASAFGTELPFLVVSGPTGTIVAADKSVMVGLLDVWAEFVKSKVLEVANGEKGEREEGQFAWGVIAYPDVVLSGIGALTPELERAADEAEEPEIPPIEEFTSRERRVGEVGGGEGRPEGPEATQYTPGEAANKAIEMVAGSADAAAKAVSASEEVLENMRKWEKASRSLRQALSDRLAPAFDVLSEIVGKDGARRILDRYRFAESLASYVLMEFRDIEDQLKSSGVSPEVMGALVYLERVGYEAYRWDEEEGTWVRDIEAPQAGRATLERNPLNIDPQTARAAYAHLLGTLTDDQRLAYALARDRMLEINRFVWQALDDAGIVGPKLSSFIRDNEHYATFQTIDELPIWIASQIKRQLGTEKPIFNPFYATAVKFAALSRFAERTKVMREVIEAAETLNLAKRYEDIDKNVSRAGTQIISITKEGRPELWIVPKSIASAFEVTPLYGGVVGKALQLTNSIIQAVLVRYSPRFLAFNVPRDIRQSLIQLSDVRTPSDVATYLSIWARSFKSAWKIYREFRADETSRRALKAMAFAPGFFARWDERDALEWISEAYRRAIESERLTKEAGGEQKVRRIVETALSPVKRFADLLDSFGAAQESASKMAAFEFLRSKGRSLDTAADIARNLAGTPNYRRAGRLAPLVQFIFPFTNVRKEGYRALYLAAKDDPLAFATKLAVFSVIPTALRWSVRTGIALALYDFFVGGGAGGDGDEEERRGIMWLTQLMRRAIPGDLVSYDIVPVAIRQDGSAVYLRIPTDYATQTFNNIVWASLEAAAGRGEPGGPIADALAFAAGETPSLNPAISLVVDVTMAALGINPIDTYRRSPKVPRNIFAARDWRTYSSLLGRNAISMLGGYGFGIKPQWESESLTPAERVMLDNPVMRVLSSWFLRRTKFGLEVEKHRIEESVRVERAREALRISELIEKTIESGGTYGDLLETIRAEGLLQEKGRARIEHLKSIANQWRQALAVKRGKTSRAKKSSPLAARKLMEEFEAEQERMLDEAYGGEGD